MLAMLCTWIVLCYLIKQLPPSAFALIGIQAFMKCRITSLDITIAIASVVLTVRGSCNRVLWYQTLRSDKFSGSIGSWNITPDHPPRTRAANRPERVFNAEATTRASVHSGGDLVDRMGSTISVLPWDYVRALWGDTTFTISRNMGVHGGLVVDWLVLGGQGRESDAYSSLQN